MSWSFKVSSFRGIDVKVHATFLLIVGLGALQWGSTHGARGAAFGALVTLALFACVLLHELGHSLVAQSFGIKVREILLLPIGGLAKLQGEPRSPKQEVAIAVAGPAVNVVLAAAFGAWCWSMAPIGSMAALAESAKQPSLLTFGLLLMSGNLTLAAFNLLPIFPLDGGRVLRAVLQMKLGAARATRWASGIGQWAAAALIVYAIVAGQLLLGLIAVLIFLAAGQENVRARLQAPIAALTAGDIAELPAVDIAVSSRIGEVVPLLLRSRQAVFPVVDGVAVVGVVFRSDVVAALQQPGTALMSVRSLTRETPSFSASLPLALALGKLRELGQPVGVVVGDEAPLGLLDEAQVVMKLAELPQHHIAPPTPELGKARQLDAAQS